MKASDTAALKAEHGAMAAMAPNAVHVARAWVRCAKGSATVALVVSRLPETARTSEDEATVTHYDAFENVRSGSGNVLACDVAASAYTATSDAPEAVSGWTQLEVAVRSAKAEHEVTVQVVVQSHSNDAAVLIDDVEFEVEAADASSVCAGGGGAGVSYKAAHKCSSDPTHLFYDLRERGGVPVAFEQVHAMVRIGFRSVSCKKPTLDATSAAECAFLSQATLPHLGADEVRAYMDARSDDELAAEMGWAEEGSRGPGVLAGASVAVGILRAGLPDAIATGVIRTVDGPEYNIHGTPADSPSSGPSPTSGIAWHAMSSSSDFKSFDDSSPSWRICSDHLSGIVRRRATRGPSRIISWDAKSSLLCYSSQTGASSCICRGGSPRSRTPVSSNLNRRLSGSCCFTARSWRPRTTWRSIPTSYRGASSSTSRTARGNTFESATAANTSARHRSTSSRSNT